MQLKKIISGLTVLAILMGLSYAFPAKAAPAILSGAGTIVNIGQITPISTLTVTEALAGEITAANDLRIRIPNGVNADWDLTDTTATINVTLGDIGVSNTVSYPNAKTLLINVTTASTMASTFTIDGLSYIGHTGTNEATLLEFSIDGGHIWANAVLGTTLAVADGTEDTLTNVTATPANPASGVTTNYTIDFTVPGDGTAPDGVIPKNGKIVLDFPDNFDVSGVAFGSATGIDGTFAIATAAGAVVTLTRQDDGNNSLGGAKQIVLNNVVNPQNAVAGQTVTVTTRTSTGAFLAEGTSSAFDINPDPIANLACVSSGMPGAIWLTWTVPQITPTGYVVKYSLANITNDTEFNNATTYNQTWAAGTAGSSKQELVMNLTPNVRYFFNVKVTGANNGLSLISNTGISCIAPTQTAPSDTTPPTSLITDPEDGVTILAGQDYKIKGTSFDTGGSSVKKVEISLDGGKSWLAATAVKSIETGFEWEYLWKSPQVGEYNLKTRAEDWFENVETPGAGIKVKVATEIPKEEKPPEVKPLEKPIEEMTTEELQVKIVEVQQKIIELLTKLIQLIQEQIQALLKK